MALRVSRSAELIVASDEADIIERAEFDVIRSELAGDVREGKG